MGTSSLDRTDTHTPAPAPASGTRSRADDDTHTLLDRDIPLSSLDPAGEKLTPPPLEDPPPEPGGPGGKEQAQEGEYPSGLRLALILLGCIAAMFLANLDMTIVATAIPRITDDFHSLNDVGWYGSAFFLTVASFQSTWGKAYKYFPLKTGFLLSIAVFELGSLICAVAPNSVALIVGRALAGLGAGGIVAGDYTIIAFSAPPRRRPMYTGLLGAVYGVASVVGPLLGGVFTDSLTWRWCFYINLPIGGFAAAIILLFFTTPAAAQPVAASGLEKLLQMDPAGTFLIMAAVVCYLLALQWGGVTLPWSDPRSFGLLIGFGLLVGVFALNEWYMGERAIVLPRLLRQRTVVIASLYSFFLQGGFFLLVYYVPIYFQSIDDTSASGSGVRNLPLILGLALTSVLTGPVVRLTGHYVPLMLAGAALATVGAGLLYTLDAGTGPGAWIGYQALVGIGVGIGIQLPISAAQSRVDGADLAPVTAMVMFFSTVGGAFLISAGQSVFANTLVRSLAHTAPGVEPGRVIATGASALHDAFTAAELPGVLSAYMDGLKAAYALGLAALGGAALLSAGMEWRTLEPARAGAPARGPA
ncbi:MFS general substrate transporter [Calocera cornea HHB12733]|uniref:MFS general substrate transporter n=1 Tax=Calocera cornea HHB12733 TaxID=1353952 RepID=A0A165DJR6_9BASI|nr:MFS general substrate transporter [Calocera cornea HHB12733]